MFYAEFDTVSELETPIRQAFMDLAINPTDHVVAVIKSLAMEIGRRAYNTAAIELAVAAYRNGRHSGLIGADL